jgi:hypothetical protein
MPLHVCVNQICVVFRLALPAVNHAFCIHVNTTGGHLKSSFTQVYFLLGAAAAAEEAEAAAEGAAAAAAAGVVFGTENFMGVHCRLLILQRTAVAVLANEGMEMSRTF